VSEVEIGNLYSSDGIERRCLENEISGEREGGKKKRKS